MDRSPFIELHYLTPSQRQVRKLECIKRGHSNLVVINMVGMGMSVVRCGNCGAEVSNNIVGEYKHERE